jgi:hypothetical protein
VFRYLDRDFYVKFIFLGPDQLHAECTEQTLPLFQVILEQSVNAVLSP